LDIGNLKSGVDFAGRLNSVLSAWGLAFAVVALLTGSALGQDEADGAIRAALAKWTQAFNGGNAGAACELFDSSLVYDFRGHPTRGREELCEGLVTTLADKSKKFSYALDIEDIQVSGDLAVVRLDWTLTITLPDGRKEVTLEPGMDVFRRRPDGSWKIVRYIAYEVEQPAALKEPK